MKSGDGKTRGIDQTSRTEGSAVEEKEESSKKVTLVEIVRYCTVFSFIVLLYCESYECVYI